MKQMYSRVKLESTDYSELDNCKILTDPDYDVLKKIYYQYCSFKKFNSVMPFFLEQYQSPNRDIIGYYDSDRLVAYSLILKYPSVNSVLGEQFAWDYTNAKLRLGIKSLENECALYKRLGYDYFYLGEHSEYKSKLKGYELVKGI